MRNPYRQFRTAYAATELFLHAYLEGVCVCVGYPMRFATDVFNLIMGKPCRSFGGGYTMQKSDRIEFRFLLHIYFCADLLDNSYVCRVMLVLSSRVS